MKDIIAGNYEITFKDKRRWYKKLKKNEILFIHKNMQTLDIIEWKLLDENLKSFNPS